MLVGPTKIANRTDIDEADFELFRSINAAGTSTRDPKQRSDSDDVPFFHDLDSGLEAGEFCSLFPATPLRCSPRSVLSVTRDDCWAIWRWRNRYAAHPRNTYENDGPDNRASATLNYLLGKRIGPGFQTPIGLCSLWSSADV